MKEFEPEPLDMFLYGLRSEITKDRYQKRLRNFFDYFGYPGTLAQQAKQFVADTKTNGTSWVTTIMIKYLMHHKQRVERKEIAVGTLRNYYKPVKAFLEQNDIELPWKKLTRGLPRGRRHAQDRIPTLSEIQKIAEYPDRRIKGIVFTTLSSGIRLGAWDYLKWSHIIPIKENDKVIAAKIRVYAGDADEYFSFISPEAYTELKKWMDYRAELGEPITGDSWLMRDAINFEKSCRGMVTFPRQLKSNGIKSLMDRVLKAQGIRKKLAPGQKRQEFQAIHGLRKYFKTHAEPSMISINVETLLDHSTGISDSYYRPNETDLLKDYLKAIPELTVLQENRIQERLSAQSSDIETTKQEMENLKEEIRRINLRNEIVDAMKQHYLAWSERNSDKVNPLQIAKTKFEDAKGVNEIVEHFLTEHSDVKTDFKKFFENSRITITET